MGLPDPVTGKVGKPAWSQTFPTKRTADDDQTRVRKAIAEGTFTHDQGMTVAEHLDDWLKRKTAAGRKLTTIEGYRAIIETRLKPAIGHHRLGRLTQHHVQAMLDRFAAEPSKGAGKGHRTITAGTLVNVRACLRAALNDAMRKGRVMRNVAELVELPPVRRPAPIAIDDERMRLWLDYAAAVDDPLAPLWLCVAVYGPRRGELLGLRSEDVDTRAKLIRVRQELVDVGASTPARTAGGRTSGCGSTW
jgi:integrase